jgi:hypothetical protein
MKIPRKLNINLKQEFITHLVRSLIVTIGSIPLIYGTALIVKVLFPSLDPTQVSLGIALLAFGLDYMNQRRDEFNTTFNKKFTDLERAIETLEDRFTAHQELYSHPGIGADYQRQTEQVYQNTAQLIFLERHLDLIEKVHSLEKKLECSDQKLSQN